MEIINFSPRLKKSRDFPEMREMILMPIGDIQYGPHSDNDKLARHVAWGVRQGAYFIGMGDYQDPGSPSERKALRVLGDGLHDSTISAINETMERKLGELMEILSPTRGRWIGLIRGHHYIEFPDGSTSDSRLADYLRCPELGHSCIVNLDLGDCQCTIWAHHGGGSSVASGGALNQLERMASGIFANIYLAGHQHTKPVVPIPFMNYSGGADTTVNRYLVSTGSFLKGYVVGSRDAAGHPSGTYVEKAMMRPVTLGAPLIKIRPRFRNGYPCPDITVSI